MVTYTLELRQYFATFVGKIIYRNVVLFQWRDTKATNVYEWADNVIVQLANIHNAEATTIEIIWDDQFGRPNEPIRNSRDIPSTEGLI